MFISVKYFSVNNCWKFNKTYIVKLLKYSLPLFWTDHLLRHRINAEIDQFRTSVHRILSDQQMQFVNVFGLPDETGSTEVRSLRRSLSLAAAANFVGRCRSD